MGEKRNDPMLRSISIGYATIRNDNAMPMTKHILIMPYSYKNVYTTLTVVK